MTLTQGQIEKRGQAIMLAAERCAEARREHSQAEAAYRHWRATTAEDCSTRHRKFPEWRVKAFVESAPGFAAHKTAIAEAREALDICEGERTSLLAMAMLTAAMHGHNPAHWLTNAEA